MKWILCKEKEPPEGIFWGFTKGRLESQGYRDIEIMLFIRDGHIEDIRTLDYGSRYTAIERNGTAEHEHIIAWMPIEDMTLPEFFYLGKEN